MVCPLYRDSTVLLLLLLRPTDPKFYLRLPAKHKINLVSPNDVLCNNTMKSSAKNRNSFVMFLFYMK